MENDLKNKRVRLYAKILAVVNSLIALPALGGTAASVLLFLMSSDDITNGIYPPVVCFHIWLATIGGLILLVGYWRQAFGKLSSAKSKILWKSTIIYNSLLLVPILIVFWLARADAHKDLTFYVYLIVNFLYCAATIVLSIFALRDDLP